MEYAKKILESKLQWLILHQESLRKSCKKKDKGLNDFFNRWAKEATVNIKSLKKAIDKLS